MLDPSPDGQLIVEIYGYDTYDPTTRTVQPSDRDDIDSWMVDTAHDGHNFFPASSTRRPPKTHANTSTPSKKHSANNSTPTPSQR